MTDRQYNCLLRNGRLGRVRGLLQSASERRILADASRSLRTRGEVSDVLGRLFDEDALGRLRVESFCEGVLVLRVNDARLAMRLRAEERKLLRQLQGSVRRVRSLRIVSGVEEEGRDD